MKPSVASSHLLAKLITGICLTVWSSLPLSVASAGERSAFIANPEAGADDIIVRGKLGGNIFGFEVDPNGTEGLLCEEVGNPDGTLTATVETFNQATGKIIRVLSKATSQDDFIAWTVAGSVGLYEREHVM